MDSHISGPTPYYRDSCTRDKQQLPVTEPPACDVLIVQLELLFGSLAGPEHRVLLQMTHRQPIGRAFQFYAGYMGLPASLHGLQFSLLDSPIQPVRSPISLNMEQGDVIRVNQAGDYVPTLAQLIGTSSPSRGLFKCNHRGCGLVFKENSDELLRHMNVHYNTQGLFYCPDPKCPLVFTLEVELEAHMAQHQVISGLMELASMTRDSSNLHLQAPTKLSPILNRSVLEQQPSFASFNTPRSSITTPIVPIPSTGHQHSSPSTQITEGTGLFTPQTKFINQYSGQHLIPSSPPVQMTSLNSTSDPITKEDFPTTQLSNNSHSVPQGIPINPRISNPIIKEESPNNSDIIVYFQKHQNGYTNKPISYSIKPDEKLEDAFHKYLDQRSDGIISLRRYIFVHNGDLLNKDQTAMEAGIVTGDRIKVFLRGDSAIEEYMAEWRQKKNQEEQDQEPHTMIEPSFTCNGCGEIFAKRSQLADHKKKAHGQKTDAVDNKHGIPMKRSSTTGAEVNVKSQKLKKLSNPDRPYVCQYPKCGMDFKRSEHLKRHFHSKHSASKFYTCPVNGCNRAFTRKDNRNQHLGKHIRAKEGIQEMVDAGLSSFLAHVRGLKIPPASNGIALDTDVTRNASSLSPEYGASVDVESSPIGVTASPRPGSTTQLDALSSVALDMEESDFDDDHNENRPQSSPKDNNGPTTGIRTRRTSTQQTKSSPTTHPKRHSSPTRSISSPIMLSKRHRTRSSGSLSDIHDVLLMDNQRNELHNITSTSTTHTSSPYEQVLSLPRQPRLCAHCGTSQSSQWRNGAEGEKLCNACGLYAERHGRMRPLDASPHSLRFVQMKSKK